MSNREFEAAAQVRYRFLEAGGGWSNFGINEYTVRLGNLGKIVENDSRNYHGPFVNIGGHYAADRWHVRANARKYFQFAAEQGFVQTLGSNTWDDVQTEAGTGYGMRIDGGGKIWQQKRLLLELTASYEYRQI